MGWATDYPYAAINLLTRVGELTKTRVSMDQVEHEPNYWVVRLTDDALFECPFTMATDVGTAEFMLRWRPSGCGRTRSREGSSGWTTSVRLRLSMIGAAVARRLSRLIRLSSEIRRLIVRRRVVSRAGALRTLIARRRVRLRALVARRRLRIGTRIVQWRRRLWTGVARRRRVLVLVRRQRLKGLRGRGVWRVGRLRRLGDLLARIGTTGDWRVRRHRCKYGAAPAKHRALSGNRPTRPSRSLSH